MAESKLAGPIGRPLDRADGRLKVTGRATYAYEYAAQGAAAYGFIVPAAIGKGRVAAVDVGDVERAPGVLLVLTKDNAPPQTPWGPADLPDRAVRCRAAVASVFAGGLELTRDGVLTLTQARAMDPIGIKPVPRMADPA